MKGLSTVGDGRTDDALTVVAEEDRQLLEILDGWDATAPRPLDDAAALVRSEFEHGTYGKLLIEHAAVRAAAKRDVARVLRGIGADRLAEELGRHLSVVQRLLERLDEHDRGVNAMGVAASGEFADAVGELATVLRADLDSEQARLLPRIATALGARRSELHSARWIRRHAPTHPAPTDRWYARIPMLVRIQAAYDHLRGFPWSHSAPMTDPKVSDSIDGEP